MKIAFTFGFHAFLLNVGPDRQKNKPDPGLGVLTVLNRGEPDRKAAKRCVTMGAEPSTETRCLGRREQRKTVALHQQAILFEHALCLPCISSGPAVSPLCASSACVFSSPPPGKVGCGESDGLVSLFARRPDLAENVIYCREALLAAAQLSGECRVAECTELLCEAGSSPSVQNAQKSP